MQDGIHQATTSWQLLRGNLTILNYVVKHFVVTSAMPVLLGLKEFLLH